MLSSIAEFFGHFHPLIVHLPIGILPVALLLQWLSGKEKYRSLQQAVPIVLLCGTVAAVVSCITGYLLSMSDDYDNDLVNWHQWMGIGVALTSMMLYAREKGLHFLISKKILSVGLLGLIFGTGHLGGSLTHGSDYLTKPLAKIFSDNSSTSAATIKPIPDAQEALAYDDIIKPILQSKCYACHGPSKQKAKLRMDDVAMLMHGGENGKVIEPGNAEASEIIKRMLLPIDHDEHMPPKEKSQPSESQIALLRWWINSGADVTKKVKDLEQTGKIKHLLFTLQKPVIIKEESTDVPVAVVEKADNKTIGLLKQKGVMISPVAQNSNYLMANFITHPLIENEDLQLLLSLRKQLIWLKLGYTNISDSSLAVIAQLTNLTRLGLQHTTVSDTGIRRLKLLPNLQYLNLIGTKVTAPGVLQLKESKALRSLYLYQTNISNADGATLKNTFPKTQIDLGGYTVTMLATDTTEVKAKMTY